MNQLEGDGGHCANGGSLSSFHSYLFVSKHNLTFGSAARAELPTAKFKDTSFYLLMNQLEGDGGHCAQNGGSLSSFHSCLFVSKHNLIFGSAAGAEPPAAKFKDTSFYL